MFEKLVRNCILKIFSEFKCNQYFWVQGHRVVFCFCFLTVMKTIGNPYLFALSEFQVDCSKSVKIFFKAQENMPTIY